MSQRPKSLGCASTLDLSAPVWLDAWDFEAMLSRFAVAAGSGGGAWIGAFGILFRKKGGGAFVPTGKRRSGLILCLAPEGSHAAE